MAKKRYQFNPETLSYELPNPPLRMRVYGILRKLLIGFFLASLANFIFSHFFYTPKMYHISKGTNEMLIRYTILGEKINAATAELNVIRQRDNNVYRQLFGTDSLYIQGVYIPYSENKYDHLQDDIYSPLMTSTWLRLDALSRVLYLESKSLDELELMAKDKELMAESIPAIWPINKKDLRNKLGYFGNRMHPILGYMRPHKGIDFGGKSGTPIYATGDGVVTSNNMGISGYGVQVLVDHGFGYKTRYAHLSKILVKPGQRVKRGEMIAQMGSTGISTSPHLHYEVLYRGVQVDPINYFSQDMTAEEFNKIVEAAKDAEATPFEDATHSLGDTALDYGDL